MFPWLNMRITNNTPPPGASFARRTQTDSKPTEEGDLRLSVNAPRRSGGFTSRGHQSVTGWKRTVTSAPASAASPSPCDGGDPAGNQKRQ